MKNNDETSKEYRWLKQTTERLNRTFKSVYKGTNGFNSYDGSNAFTSLFAGFYNFLRRHSSLGYEVPVKLDEVEAMPDMPSKWLKLLSMSCDYLADIKASA
ncbi:MAG: integrase core domain-containing protein [Candidatus Marinimicrobia bacterium]|nr:integrase core domain-containing protein [Candidatus Neomarinimicrobiota bacterium]